MIIFNLKQHSIVEAKTYDKPHSHYPLIIYINCFDDGLSDKLCNLSFLITG